MSYFESRNGATTSRVSLLGTTGTISKVMPSPWQFSTHSWSSRASSHSISWKQPSKFGRLDPAPDVSQPLGKFYALVAHALIDRDRVAIPKTLDHHEEHG
jgi:hypothetical protein